MKATDQLRTPRVLEGQAAGNRREELVNDQISQVYCIARRIRRRLPQEVELDDLVSAGVVGLVQAALSFDPGKQVPFSAFAKFRIHGAIMDSLRETDWASRSLRKSGRAIAEASTRLQSRLGRQPSESKIAQELGISAEKLHLIQGQIHSLNLSVQQVAHSDDDTEWIDLIESAPSENDPNPLETYLAVERKALLAEAVARLTEREQSIVQLYYREENTMKEISEALGISLSRVSQLREAIMAKLRESLEELRVRPVLRSLQEDERSVDVP